MTHSVRITIGGVEVDALDAAADPGKVRAERPASGSGDVPLIAHARVSNPVMVAGESGLPTTCPIPLGPWRLAGVVALAAATIAIIVAICARPRSR